MALKPVFSEAQLFPSITVDLPAPEDEFFCPVCYSGHPLPGRSRVKGLFHNYSDFGKHMKISHKTTSFEFRCVRCGAIFDGKMARKLANIHIDKGVCGRTRAMGPPAGPPVPSGSVPMTSPSGDDLVMGASAPDPLPTVSYADVTRGRGSLSQPLAPGGLRALSRPSPVVTRSRAVAGPSVALAQPTVRTDGASIRTLRSRGLGDTVLPVPSPPLPVALPVSFVAMAPAAPLGGSLTAGPSVGLLVSPVLPSPPAVGGGSSPGGFGMLPSARDFGTVLLSPGMTLSVSPLPVRPPMVQIDVGGARRAPPTSI